jgi:TorA maturation chaperone TorD
MELFTKSLPIEEVENVLYSRQFAYDILRRFFVEEPSREYVKQFVQKNMIDLFPFKEESAEIREGVAAVKEFLAAHDVVNIERHYQDLHWDYTRMFIGPFSLPTPPWESSYVRKDCLLFQGTTMEVRKLYEKYGIAVSDFNIEADDHVGLELDFIYHLNELCLSLCQSDQESDFGKIKELLEEQSQFLHDHLLQFIPQLCEKIITEANTSFFAGLAKILKSYLKIDLEVLHELLNIEIL